MRHALDDAGWRALFATEDPAQARVVATCVAAMEFAVRLDVDGTPDGRFGGDDAPALDDDGRYVVEVMRTDWPLLAEVLDEIIAEQAQFDEIMDDWDRRSTRPQRRLLAVMIVIVGTLAVVGAIDL